MKPDTFDKDPDNISDKIWEIAAFDDASEVFNFLSKIQAAVLSTYSYLDSFETEKYTNNVLYMLDIINNLTDMADKKFSEIIDKICKICKGTEESK